MKKFKDFIEEGRGIKSVHADPVHGKHSQKKDVGIVSIHADPTHGKHSQVKSKQRSLKFTKEDAVDPYSKAHWYNEHDNNHIGSDKDEVHEKLNPEEKHWNSFKHSEHLHNYSSSSNSLNRELINRDKGQEHMSYYDNHIKGLDAHLAGTSLKHDHLNVYHGTRSWNPATELKKTKDNTLHIPTYLSTSIHKKTAGSFAGSEDYDGHGRHIIHIKVQKGQKGQYLGSHSAYPEEHEFLMPRGQKLKFHPEPKVVHDHAGPVHIWTAHAIQDKEFHHDPQDDSRNQLKFSFMKSRRRTAE